jgi:predicted permease
MDAIFNDLKYAWRSLRRSPGFALSAILTLALGIGANSVIFTGVYRLLFDPMPFLTEPDRLLSVFEVAPAGRNDHNEFALANFNDLRTSSQSFASLAAHAWLTINLTGGDRPERVQGMRVTANFFDTLGARPLLGRTFAPGEEGPGRDDVVVLSHGLWMRRFGGDQSILNQRISVNGVTREVVGIMPEGVRYPAPAEMWLPFAYTEQQWTTSRRGRLLLVEGRLKPGVTKEEAAAEVRTLAARMASSYPDSNGGWSANAQPFVADANRTMRPMLTMLFAAVGLVLLIACANVANLLLARGAARQRELAVRAALGAARGRVRQQLFIESLVVAAGGGLLAIIFCVWGVGALAALVPAAQQRFIVGFDRLGVDATVIAFTAGLSILTALLFGVLPAIKAAGRNLLPALQERARGSSGERYRARKTLVTIEVALAVVLLIGAGLTLRSFQNALAADLGFNPDGVATTSVVIPAAKYPTPDHVARFYEQLVTNVAALPGVKAAAAVNITPLCQCNQTTSFQIEGRPPFERAEQPDVGYRTITPDYFSVMSIPLRAGRAFTPRDVLGQPLVVIINETIAKTYFAGQDPVGQRMRFGAQGRAVEIVAVVADVRHRGPAQPPQGEVYFPEAQETSQSMTLVVKTDADATALAAPIRTAVEAIDVDQPVYDQRTMRDVVNLAMGPFNFARQLLAVMAAVALFLSAVGIYGVIAHIVGERSREIGIRIALGGSRRTVVRSVVAQAIVPAVWGIALGVIGAGAVTSALAAGLIGVRPLDPITFVSAALLLLACAAAAGYVPARRAARVDPAVTLRSE